MENTIDNKLKELTDEQLREKILLNSRKFSATKIMIALQVEVARRLIFKNKDLINGILKHK